MEALRRTCSALALIVLTAACGPDAAEREAALAAAERAALAPVEAAIDSADRILDGQVGLTAATRRDLRRSLNPRQVRTARKLGVEPVRDPRAARRLVAGNELVVLEDSTDYWILRDLTHSVPYVTPDTRAMLMDLGRRFHARLDSLGLPRFRFEITSVLRTAAMQADLRSGNANASRTTSSHEYGTTVDVAYNSFAPPADIARLAAVRLPDTLGLSADERREIERRVRDRARSWLGDVATERAAALKGILGNVLQEMQEENRVEPLIERAQPVYHMTVAARYDDAERATAVSD